MFEAAAARAEAAERRRHRIANGDWWLREDAFASLGAARRVSLPRMAPTEGMTRRHGTRRRRAGFLDFGPHGIAWRRTRDVMRIPWDRVTRIALTPDERGRAILRVHLIDGKAVAFASLLLPGDQIGLRLQPLTGLADRADAAVLYERAPSPPQSEAAGNVNRRP
ncbi:MAG: hypothetical protein ACYDEN_04795 [Acidimicrobiales bacterium]